jgi:hypothetical protein
MSWLKRFSIILLVFGSSARNAKLEYQVASAAEGLR